MKLIIGCGYLGLRVARRWLAAGHVVAGVVRSEETAQALAAESIRPILADVTRPETLHNLPPADTLLYSVGYRPAEGTSRWNVYVDGLRAVLAAIPAEVGRVILISSTGVYSERSGDWIDEDSPCEPSHESGRALLAAEQALAAHRLSDRGIVLRLAGIYGPGRLPRRAELTSGEPLAIPAGHYLNLIHVDDAASAVLAAEVHASPPQTYVIADGQPVERREFLLEMARQLDLPEPTFREPLPGEAASGRGGNKRASNRRMLEELQVELQFPMYREGLRDSVLGLKS